ncbi:MAG: HPr family phosphocarrier protein [Verrucomicrobiae bacterium]|nr:HPr family phosphocarrier protein [Verrucomicrobiae bacterium]
MMNAVLTAENSCNPKPGSRAAEAGAVRQVFVLKNHQGLHCRPAALIINTLKGLVCTVIVENDGISANARSIFELLNLAAGYQTKLTFTVTGPDANKALAAIQRIFESNFADAYDDNHPLSHKQMRAF